MIFQLPNTTTVNRSIPKNAFDKFTTSKQKKAISENIDKIKWLNKLAPETINLQANEVKQYQLAKE